MFYKEQVHTEHFKHNVSAMQNFWMLNLVVCEITARL